MDDVKSEEDTKVDTKNIDFMEEDFKDEFLKHEQYSDSNICFSLIQVIYLLFCFYCVK